MLFAILKNFGVPPRMPDSVQCTHRDDVVSTMVGDIKVTIPNGGGVKQGDRPSPEYFREATVEVYKEKYPAVQFEFCCSTRQEGGSSRARRCSSQKECWQIPFVFFLSLS